MSEAPQTTEAPTLVHQEESPGTPLPLNFVAEPQLHAGHARYQARHAFRRHQRYAAYRALHANNATPEQLAAFTNCGQDAVVLRDKADCDHYRFAPITCKNRFCPACAAEKAHKIASNLARHITPATTRFITLTLRDDGEPLTALLTRLRAGFRRLRRRPLWKERVTGFAAFIETKYKLNTKHWHVHLHVVANGRYIPRADLSAEWLACTGDSMVIDIRRIDTSPEAARYVAKYAGKGLDTGTYQNPDALNEAVDALKNAKLVIKGGTLAKVRLIAPVDETPAGWERVADVGTFLAHVHGEASLCNFIADAWQQYIRGQANDFTRPSLAQSVPRLCSGAPHA